MLLIKKPALLGVSLIGWITLDLFYLALFCFVNGPTALATQRCDPASVDKYIQRLDKIEQEEIEFLSQCEIAIPSLISALKSPNQEVAANAALVFQWMGEPAKDAGQPLVGILLDSSKSIRLRTVAAYALQTVRPGDNQTIKALLTVIKQEKISDLRSSATLALGKNSNGEKETIEYLLQVISSLDDNSVRSAAAYAISDIAKSHQEAVRTLVSAPIISILQDSKQNSRVIVACIRVVNQTELTDKNAISALTNLLKYPDGLVNKQAATTLANISDRLYEKSLTLQDIKEKLPVVQQIKLELDQLSKSNDSDIKVSIKAVSETVKNFDIKQQTLIMQIAQQWAVGDRAFWIIHPLFWLALIFAYPKSSRVQAIFFWNKYIREILGLWYVSALLTWVAPLRCRLFAPFKDSLLADAKLDSFDFQAFFSQSEVKLKGTDAIQPIQQVLPEIKGQIILEGESGLGKTMMLRQLVRQSKRITVYLPAQKCENGVIEAIQAKLHGQAQDADFLKKLIYSGAIDICIDGLNEVKPDVRANIKAFVESYFKGNVIMTTQPLLWDPPSTAKTYILQPLQRDQIEQFLHLRGLRLPPDSKLRGADYKKVCTEFLANALTNQSVSDDSVVTRHILSNPMDLTIVAQMLARNVQPDLFHLQEQQYKLMAEDYERSWNQPFPLKQFSEFVYQMRDKDDYAITGESFYQALTVMEKEQYRMVLSRQWKDKKGDNKQEWAFRHDKILEFFIVQTFISSSPEGAEKRKKHMGDPRFRGIYLLLAQVLPLNDALALREELIQYAADTQDHTVSDAYVQLMRSRC